MVKLLLATFVAVGLSGCVQVRGTAERGMSDAEIDTKDDRVCLSFGAEKGSQSYIDCRLRLRSDRSAEDRIRRFSP